MHSDLTLLINTISQNPILQLQINNAKNAQEVYEIAKPHIGDLSFEDFTRHMQSLTQFTDGSV